MRCSCRHPRTVRGEHPLDSWSPRREGQTPLAGYAPSECRLKPWPIQALSGAWRPRTAGGRTAGFTVGDTGSTERANDLAATDQTPALARRGPSTTSALANPNYRPSQATARTKGQGILLTTHFSGADKGRLELGHASLSAVSPAGRPRLRGAREGRPLAAEARCSTGLEAMTSGRAARPGLLGLPQYGVLALGLSLMLTLAFCALNDEGLYFYNCRYSYLPSVQERYGFEVGSVRAGDDVWRPGLVKVTPGGILDKAGFRSGDIPVAYHGGFSEFCAAVQESGSGRESFELVVVNTVNWETGERRRLRVPAVAPVK